MNKSFIIEDLPCGCEIKRWLFGKEYLRRCVAHSTSELEARARGRNLLQPPAGYVLGRENEHA